MSAVEVRQVVSELCGRRGDETIRDYIKAVLELGDYDWGRNGENAYEHFGQMLVRHSRLSILQRVLKGVGLACYLSRCPGNLGYRINPPIEAFQK